MSSFKHHVQDEDDNEYATPPKLWRPLSNAVGGFDVDPCSGAENTPIAPTRYTKDDDGLKQAWHGDVFVNPPWSSNGDGSAKDTWLTKCRNEAERDEVRTVTVILPCDTSAHWYHDHILAGELVCHVGPGRIPFEGEDRNPSFEMLIAVYGEPTDELVDALDSFGAVFRGRSLVEPTTQTRLA